VFALSHGEDLRCRNEAAWFAFQVTSEEDDDTTRVAQAGNTDQLRQDEVWYWPLANRRGN
jgi:hypothetical protein